MHTHKPATLNRDLIAIQIPGGAEITLPVGTTVYITQMLGGTITVATDHGLARIARENADALGIDFDKETPEDQIQPCDGTLEDKVWNALKSVFDPEIPVDIVNLGLVYDCIITESKDNPGKHDVIIKMTLTAPGCGMGPIIASDAEGRVASLPEVSSATVDLVWDPPWNQDMVSEEGKMILGFA